MKTIRLMVALLALVALAGCAEKKESTAVGSEISDAESSGNQNRSTPNQPARYLAYIHQFSLSMEEEKVAESHSKVAAACEQDTQYRCVVLHASLDSGYGSRSQLRLRLLPEGVPHFSSLLNKQGEVVSHSTTAEDLGDQIVDTSKRIEMLTSYRAKLTQLEAKPDNDIDSSIKIASELSKVQNELEFAQGKRTKLLQRVQTDLLNITMFSPSNTSSWSTIADSFDDFGMNFSEGIASVITAAAYVFPWGLFLIILFFIVRSVWRLARRK